MKKLGVILMSIVMVFAISTTTVFASTITTDEITVTLTTDKTDYAKGEAIKATLTVVNNNDVAIENLSVQTVVPEGYELAEGSESTKTIAKLESGETQTINVNSKTTSADTQTTQSTTEKDEESNGVSNIKTYIIIALLVLVCALVLIIVIKNKKSKQLMSIVLCVATLGTTTAFLKTDTFAANVKTIELSQPVLIDSKTVEVKAIISYDEVEKVRVEPTNADFDELIGTFKANFDDGFGFDTNSKDAVEYVYNMFFGFFGHYRYYDYDEWDGFLSIKDISNEDADIRFPEYCLISKISDEKVDWILKNVYNIEPDHSIELELEYEDGLCMCHKDGYYYVASAETGYLDVSTTVKDYKVSSDGTYYVVIEQNQDPDYSSSNGYFVKMLVVADFKEVDGRTIWSYKKAEYYGSQNIDLDEIVKD